MRKSMKKNLQTTFHTRQYMLSKYFELYYYNDLHDDRLNYKVRSHTHNYYEFYFFLEGDVSIRIDGAEYPLKAGNMILIPPLISHQVIIHNTSIPYRRFVFWISENFYHQLQIESEDYIYVMQQVQKKKNYIYSYDRILFHELQARIFQLLEEIHSSRFGKDIKISLCVHELLLYINRSIYEKDHHELHEETQNLYQNLLYYIETHLEEDLSLDRLAHEFYISKYHISHIFKEKLGLSIHQFITKKRLLMCRDAIASRKKIGEIYLLYGFKDYSSFFRAFKKEFGMSPKEYKEQIQAKYSSTSPVHHLTEKNCQKTTK